MASEVILKQKQEEVKKLSETMKKSSLILLTDYRGINVSDVTELRKKLRNVNGKYSVIKNNITKRALSESSIEGLDDLLVGPTAVITAEEDYLAPLKAVYEYAKNNEFYKIKGGVIDGKVLSVEEIITLAKLPSREELIAKLAGSLLGTISKLAVAIDQVAKQKEQA
ncbi:MAG: 50S ribosomal protein L10 [Clostridia bacterium]|nr:50S ribosomal protein L10 [Clostridia bacterium]